MGYVYFLQLSNGDIYVGSTNDLRRRFKSHQQGHVISTRQHLPVVLRTYVAVIDEAQLARSSDTSNRDQARHLQRSDFLAHSALTASQAARSPDPLL